MQDHRFLAKAASHSTRAAIAILAAASAAHAQEALPALPEVVVTATPFNAGESAQILVPARVLAGDALRNKLEGSIGDTLANEPGISASAFGAGASRPVIRGLGGPRVRVMQNGMGSADVSAISEDHAAGVDPYSARRIEILRGPAALLYGSGAAGGLVNLVNGRIPETLEAQPTGELEVRYGTADNGRALSLSADGAAGRIGLHVDGSFRDTNDYRLASRAVRDDPESPAGRLPSSATRAHSLGFGASIVDSWGHIGASVAVLDNRYGIPTDEQATIDLEKRRYDIDALLKQPFAGAEQMRFRLGYTDYAHTEIASEEEGESGSEAEERTDFSNDTLEMRWELAHKPVAGWRGVFGLHAESADFAAVSREPGHPSTVPETRSRAYAAFLVEERDFGPARVNAGARIENAVRDPEGGQRRSFDLASWSAGVAWTGIPGYSFGPTFSVAQRAPSAEELYSGGPHHATETFDRGDSTLDKETSRNLELTLQKTEGLLRWRVNLFQNRIRNFVYGQLTGVTLDHEGNPGDELDERVYRQAGAKLRGAEAEISHNLRGQGLSLRAFADTSRGRLDGSGGWLPLQPATRVGAEVGYRQGAWRAGASVIRAQRQERLAANETATPGYTRVDASLSWTQRSGPMQLTWFALLKNLLDEDIRLSTSLLKDSAPLPGRSLVVGVRTAF
ncbi:MAG TPA: TonB-dependent receptor [Noviherbaspirillum sp.]|jgi:iron complex outermembrane receptor protein|uniref:TonB-dependent receptor n=1 Tax=Noviherbaspirillum sp. TaxID=1926288 RepID=UPI002F91F475